MISPTLATLQQLQTYANADEVFTVLDSKPSPENIRIVDESKLFRYFQMMRTTELLIHGQL